MFRPLGRVFRRPSLRLLSALGVLASTLVVSAPSQATIVERIVAVVGERAILLSELRERAQPFLVRIEAEVPPGPQRAAAVSQIYSMLIERLVDEELQQRAATRAQLTVTAAEIDAALERIAAQNEVSVERLMAEARANGMSEKTYRGEIRRQVTEAKLLNLRLQGRVRVSEDDLKSAYRKIAMEERRKLRFRPAWIAVRAPADSVDVSRRRQLAERLAQQARLGEEFATLARAHSDDATTREAGGELGWLAPGQLPAVLDRAALALDAGEVSEPVRHGDHLYVLKILEREESNLPTYDEARGELSERVYMEKMNKARRHWLDGLRRNTHVEVRL